jgi:outer membrane lipoprotein
MRQARCADLLLYSLSFVALLLHGCGPKLIPKELEGQVDRNVSFLQLKQSPQAYIGRLVVLGGEVLVIKRSKDQSRMEVLQLPLDSSLRPVADRITSQGRFLAIQKEFLDPATVPAGTPVTIIGDVTGTTTLPLDEIQYVYPTLNVRHLRVWERTQPPYYTYPPVSIGIGGIFGFFR